MKNSVLASAHTGELGVDEYPDISGITNARVYNFSFTSETVFAMMKRRLKCVYELSGSYA